LPSRQDRDEVDWVDYAAKVEITMSSKGIWKHALGTAVTPTPFQVEAGVPVSKPGTPATDVEIEAKDKKIDDHDQKQAMVRLIILSTVSPRLCSQIRSKTAAEMWTLVKDDATTKGQIYKVGVRKRLTDMRCTEDGDIRGPLSAMTKLKDELSAMGINYKDEEYVPLLLGSMPASYHMLLSAITQSAAASSTQLKSEVLVNVILEEAAHREAESKHAGSAETALHMSRGAKGKGKSSKSHLLCDNCHKTGHTGPDCYAPGGGKEGQAPWQKKKAAQKANAKKQKDSVRNSAESGSSNYAFSLQEPLKALATVQSDDAVADSAASSHFSPLRDRFRNIYTVAEERIEGPNGSAMVSTLRGDVSIDLPNGSKTTNVTLKDAFYVPDMTRTLISIGKLDQAGFSAEFGGQKCIIRAPAKKVIAQLPLINGLYKVNEKSSSLESANVAVQKVSLAEAHQIMGHVSHSAVKATIAKGRIVGIVLDDSNSTEFCDACAQAKPHRKLFPKEAKNRAKEFGERIFTDLWGPTSVESLGKKRYSLDFTDDATRWTEADFLENKTQTLASYKTFEQ
jgi:hypothetical protein